MKSILFLSIVFTLLIGGFGLVNHNAFALSCQEDETGICDQFLYRGPLLKQLESGTGLGDVFCSNTNMVIKISTGAPACVFDLTLDKLLERGWGTTLDDHIKNGPADGSSLKYTLVEVLDPVNYSCVLEPDPGFCKANIPKYYFNETTNSCQEFVWGGCNGVVPFETLSACQQQCK